MNCIVDFVEEMQTTTARLNGEKEATDDHRRQASRLLQHTGTKVWHLHCFMKIYCTLNLLKQIQIRALDCHP